MIIKFNNWEKFHPRKDYKKDWWFAFSNDFMTNPNFLEFTNEERLVFVYLLCEASKQMRGGEVELIVKVFSRLTDLKCNVILQTIEKLKKKDICTECVQNPFATEQNRTEQNRTNTEQFDFDALYDKYPKKEGKTEGIDRLRAMIKTEEEYGELERAICNYTLHLKNTGCEPRFIKQFPSFIGTLKKQTWRDWLDPKNGSAISLKKERDLSFLKD